MLDIALAGQTAAIEAIEQDYEGKIHVCVVLDDDPGRDLGLLRQPGHRFFFDVDEVEPLPPRGTGARRRPLKSPAFSSRASATSSWVTTPLASRWHGCFLSAICRAGARWRLRHSRLRSCLRPAGWIRDHHPYRRISARRRTGNALRRRAGFRLARGGAGRRRRCRRACHGSGEDPSVGGVDGQALKRVLLVGCEPATLGPEEGLMGLSEPVKGTVTEAVDLVESVIQRVLAGEWPGSGQ